MLAAAPLPLGVAACSAPPLVNPCSATNVGQAYVNVREDMSADDLAALARVAREGQLLLVQYNGCHLRPLWGCTQDSSYQYTELSGTQEPGESSLAVQSNMPAQSNAAQSNAPPQAAQGGSVVRGTFSALAFNPAVPRSESCAWATHGIVAITAGAFEREGPFGKESFGNDGTCGKQPRGEACASPMTVKLAPLKDAPVLAPRCADNDVLEDGRCVVAAATCPPGTLLEGGVCVPVAVTCEGGGMPQQGWCPPRTVPWALPTNAPAREQIMGLIRAINAAQAEPDVTAGPLLELAELYKRYDGLELPGRSRVQALQLALRTESVRPVPVLDFKIYKELLPLTLKLGMVSDHLDAANEMIRKYPREPESSIAYLAAARYFCKKGDQESATRFTKQMQANIQKPTAEAASEAKQLSVECGRVSAAKPSGVKPKAAD